MNAYEVVSLVLLLWNLLLVVGLTIYGIRARTTAGRSLLLNALSPVIITILAILAASRLNAAYLDVALVIAMLGVTQTLTVVRTAERHEELK